MLRILVGLIKKFVLADSLRGVIDPVLLQPDAYSKLRTLATIGLCSWRIYLDFSGYSDVALGTGALFGYRIPENFNWPFFQPSIAAYWRNWHISFHDFFRDYFFLPLFGAGATRAKIYIGICCTMLLVNLWQGLSLNFLIAGVSNGVALVAWYRFQELKRRQPAIRDFMKTKTARILSTALTFGFVSFNILLAYANLDRAWSVLVRLFA
jgi:D-alanyl-lipoteichoic acid acyltransferase DltB (MBOAT superfamily)